MRLREDRLFHDQPGMREAILAGAAIAAAGTAYAANQQRRSARDAARAASAPQTQTQDVTTTNTSSQQAGPAYVQDDFEFASNEARRLYDQGPVLRGGGGGGGGRGGGGGGQGDVVYQGGVAGVMSKNGKFQPLGAAAQRKAAGGGGGGAAARPGMEAQNRQIGQRIIDQGLAGDPNQAAADAYVQDVLEPGSFGGNEVFADLNERYSNASLDEGNSLLMQFMQGYQDPAPRTTSAKGPAGGGYAGANYASYGPGGAAAQPAGGTIGDSTRGDTGLFSTWARDVLGGKYIDPNDPNLAAYLETIQREGGEDLERELQDIGDEFEGVGMYGGSGLALERGYTRNKGNQKISDARTKALLDFRGQGLGLMDSVGGQVNQRDISAADIAASERSAANAAASSSAGNQAALDAQLQIANRGMNLDALGMFLQNNQFGLGELGDIGGSINQNRLGALDSLGDLNNLRFSGLDRAFGVSGQLGAQDAAQRQRREERRYQDALAPSRHLDEYMNRLGFFGSLGGTSSSTSRTQGTTTGQQTVAPQYTPSPLAAGLMAGAGTYFAGAGSQQGASSSSGGGRSATYQPPNGTGAPKARRGRG